MIPPGLADLWAAARALRAVPRADWPVVMRSLLAQAEAADAARRAGTPTTGDGSLMAAALTRPGVWCSPAEPEALAALALAARLTGRHLAQAERGAVKTPRTDYLGPS